MRKTEAAPASSSYSAQKAIAWDSPSMKNTKPITANDPPQQKTRFFIDGKEVTEQEMAALKGVRSLHSELNVYAVTK